ncbi:MAG TPA: aminotransferase class III-fold pyridoxal phosphate-dependent enzyme [Phycisphaerales bacterium]|nr:aminotransferase class III-fold pyridoxal phosphate-dependent enzyme [Phycisphaerales bacterium]
MTQTAARATVGERFFASAGVQRALEAIAASVREHGAEITDVRPPRSELKESYDSLMTRAGEARGRALLYPYIGSGLGNGALVELADGSVKWDMICGIGVHFFGHSDPELIQHAVLGSITDTVMHGNLQTGFEPYEFSEALLEEAAKGSNLKHCFVAPSGALVNENALKLAYQKSGGAPRVIAFKDCFMGRTVTMSQLGDSAANRIGIPLSTLVDYMPFYDEGAAAQGGMARQIDAACQQLLSFIERYPKQHACFIFELVQGEGGFNTAPREFFVELMKICRQHGIAVWDDEIQTFGRTTSMFLYDAMQLGEYVDLATVGKMTQACATLFTEAYNPGPGLLSATFTSSGAACRVGTYVINQLRQGDFYGEDGRIARHHRAFREQARAMIARHPEWFPKVEPGVLSPAPAELVGGAGGMMRFTPFGGRKDKINRALKTCFEEGVILFSCGHGPYHVRLLPPLGVMKLEDWARVFACMERGLAKAAV